MKALSIRQPWVHAILHEGKQIENRKWPTNHRGWIAIHASAKPLRGEKFPRGILIPDLKNLHYSAICGVARISDVVTHSRSKWFHHPEDGTTNYGWILTEVTLLKIPIPCPGALKLWNVPPSLVREIQRQLSKLNLNDSGL